MGRSISRDLDVMEDEMEQAKTPPYFARDDIPEDIKQAHRKEGGRVGGRKRKYLATGPRIPIEGIEDVRKGVERVIANLSEQDNTPATCRALLDAYRLYHAILVDEDLKEIIEKKLEALEESLG